MPKVSFVRKDRQTNRQTDKRTNRQKDKKTKRQKDRKTKKLKDKNTKKKFEVVKPGQFCTLAMFFTVSSFLLILDFSVLSALQRKLIAPWLGV